MPPQLRRSPRWRTTRSCFAASGRRATVLHLVREDDASGLRYAIMQGYQAERARAFENAGKAPLLMKGAGLYA